MASTLRDMCSVVPRERHDELQLALEWLDDCQAATGGLTPRALRWGWETQAGMRGAHLHSEVLFSAFMASRNMSSKSKAEMTSTIKHCVNVVVPPALRPAVELSMDARALPSKESIRQAQMSIDAAMCLMGRQARVFEERAVYMWWDATPHGQDWLLSQIHSVRNDSLCSVYKAACALMMATRGQPTVSSSPACKQNAELVTRQISCHTMIPVALGLRSSSLAHKVAALFHALLMETGSLEGIREYCKHVVSITTDLGTEVGIGDMHAIDIADFIPDWLLPVEVEADGAEDETPPDRNGVTWDAAWLLQRAIQIPGMLHIVSNILTEAHYRLSYWGHFPRPAESSEQVTLSQSSAQPLCTYVCEGYTLGRLYRSH